ncbi:MAG TPA: ABC transporter permease [Rhodanobacteraceae bacterium]
MKTWWHAFGVEWLKLKHTSIPWLVLLMPAGTTGLVALTWLIRQPPKVPPSPALAWLHLGNGVCNLWCLLLPMFVALLSTLLVGLEHGNTQWKHLLALPMRRDAHYLGKWCVTMALMVLAYACLWACVLLAGRLLMVSTSQGLAGWPAWHALGAPMVLSLGASMLITALQTWLAMRRPGFGLPIAVGALATIASIILIGSKWARYFPWTLPREPFLGHAPSGVLALAIGLAGGCVVGLLGLADFLHRENT